MGDSGRHRTRSRPHQVPPAMRRATSALVEKSPLTCYDGAEDGIRTRDPHLGKVMRYRCATSALGLYCIAPPVAGEGPRNPGPTSPYRSRSVAPAPPLSRIGRLPKWNRTRQRPSSASPSDRSPTTTTASARALPGLLTRLLVKRIPHVTAIEPDDRMRALLAASAPDLEAIQGHAEEIPVPSSSYDVVIAQSAWHWVDGARAVPEVARVLRPHGRLSLAWTGTDRSVDWMRSLWAGGVELDPAEKNEVDRGRRSRHMVNVEAGGPSPFEEPETRLFRWTRPMSKSDLVALAATYSRVIVMDDGARREHLDSMMRYLDTHEAFSGADIIDVPMRSYCWRATKR